jgi:hypothetical protein
MVIRVNGDPRKDLPHAGVRNILDAYDGAAMVAQWGRDWVDKWLHHSHLDYWQT